MRVQKGQQWSEFSKQSTNDHFRGQNARRELPLINLKVKLQKQQKLRI